tara:strand:+ start:292 stop:519 length:228 start_codon:yes stop_codon:yes gene_type:complete
MSENTPKYNNPSALALIGRFVRKQNTQLIDDYGEKHSLSPKQLTNLKTELIKLNHIYPNVVQKKNREYLQILLIK